MTSNCWKDFMYEVIAIPQEANPKAIKTAAGIASKPHKLGINPKGTTTAINAHAYENPRKSAQPISPNATSSGPMDVASMPW